MPYDILHRCTRSPGLASFLFVVEEIDQFDEFQICYANMHKYRNKNGREVPSLLLPPYELGPAQGFFPLKGSSSCHRCLLGASGSGPVIVFFPTNSFSCMFAVEGRGDFPLNQRLAHVRGVMEEGEVSQ